MAIRAISKKVPLFFLLGALPGTERGHEESYARGARCFNPSRVFSHDLIGLFECVKILNSTYSDAQFGLPNGIGRFYIWTNNIICSSRIDITKHSKRSDIEGVRIDFGLHGVHIVRSSIDYEVDFSLVLITPIMDYIALIH
jgi:hypothetical protein